MIYKSKEFKLKDSTVCTLRNPLEEEALQMMEYLRTCAEETHFISRYPEECTETEEEEANFLRNVNNSKLSLMLVAVIDGNIAGNCQLNIHKRMKVRHKGSIGISIIRKYWNKGIGTIMFQELERVARENGCRQLELEVMEDNVRAIALYEKMGFRIFAKRKRGIILKDSTELSEYLMEKFLD